ncbi:hypothetical protein LX36DRAFT_439124 [Colletotrichum falcatum]|nr:hypothetical protein LX36DRAFT_439124 [Colletotrichum falcatum]
MSQANPASPFNRARTHRSGNHTRLLTLSYRTGICLNQRGFELLEGWGESAPRRAPTLLPLTHPLRQPDRLTGNKARTKERRETGIQHAIVSALPSHSLSLSPCVCRLSPAECPGATLRAHGSLFAGFYWTGIAMRSGRRTSSFKQVWHTPDRRAGNDVSRQKRSQATAETEQQEGKSMGKRRSPPTQPWTVGARGKLSPLGSTGHRYSRTALEVVPPSGKSHRYPGIASATWYIEANTCCKEKSVDITQEVPSGRTLFLAPLERSVNPQL